MRVPDEGLALVVLVAIALCAAPAFAQVTAAISGTVEDQAGGLVSGAVVTVKSLETGVSRVYEDRCTPGRSGYLRCRWGRRK